MVKQFKKEILLPSSIYDKITSLSLKNQHIEIVGLLFGFKSKKYLTIDFFKELENIDASANSFSIKSEDYSQFIKYENKETGRELLGFVHSHPKKFKLDPSKKDIEFMRLWPEYIWGIVTFELPVKNVHFNFFTIEKTELFRIYYQKVCS